MRRWGRARSRSISWMLSRSGRHAASGGGLGLPATAHRSALNSLRDSGSNDWADPDVEVVIVDGPELSSGSGPAAMAAGWREVLSARDGYRSAAEEFGEIDGLGPPPATPRRDRKRGRGGGPCP